MCEVVAVQWRWQCGAGAVAECGRVAQAERKRHCETGARSVRSGSAELLFGCAVAECGLYGGPGVTDSDQWELCVAEQGFDEIFGRGSRVCLWFPKQTGPG